MDGRKTGLGEERTKAGAPLRGVSICDGKDEKGLAR